MTARELRVGVVALLAADQWPGTEPGQLVRMVRTVEDLGFDSLWANDSLIGPRIEALTFLAAAAAVAERVTLGTAALLPALRRPVQAAQALASLDRLAQGRLVVAVGAGFPGVSEAEYAVSEVSWRRRSRRLDETVALWRQLWAGAGPRSFHGDTIILTDIPAGITPFNPGGPPVWLAGDTPRARARAGSAYDGWLPYPPTPSGFAAGLGDVRAAAELAGRPAGAVTPALFVTVLVTDSPDGGRAELDRFTTATYGFPLAAVESLQAFAAGSAEVVAAKLASYVEAGVRHLVCRIGVLTQDAFQVQLRRLRDVKERLEESSHAYP
ncbi:LLM class flavin-dependent oxidoreductase [Mycolicibacter sinensis]|uniref:N5,N10-methylene tetrahydromethanopterin reductase n=1 Tax=Mycolicibacter sinensis (strain JDM601) TaxID=875328 RepID=A0A1A3U6N0_MYCSD|nr:LLM class flavin-dependent oxidoreductase [Mycolicibacter sinensis]OBK90570.1 N5,N10-methylene tetrahydromethanopterin reductase [Mycolicibacter sinensis]